MREDKIKLCVIDDIRSVIDMISTKIDWEAYGIEVAGTAINGQEGLELIRRVQPDIVMTDVRMPKLDGLEMMRRVLEALPHSKVIMLSGYSEFTYAQQAIRLGAYDFLQKPFSIAEIIRVVVGARDVWLEERKGRLEVDAMEKRLKESLPLLRQEYMNMLIHHRSGNAQSNEKRWAFLKIPLKPENLVVMIVEIDRFAENFGMLPTQEVELVRFALQNILEETINSFTAGIVFREGTNRHVCVLNCEDVDLASRIAEACCAHIAKYTRFTISIGIGRKVEELGQLPDSFLQALNALSYHFYTGGNGVLSFDQTAKDAKGLPKYSLETERELLFAMRSGNREKSMALLEQLIGDLFGSSYHKPEYVRSVCQELAFMMYRVLLEQLSDTRLSELEHRLREGRNGELSMQELRELLVDLCRQGCEWMEKERVSESKQVIRQAIAYIQSNLGKALTVEICAKQVNLSIGYFSNLFKKVTGTTFQQYVTQERIERAKVMLVENYQVQEIAEELSYEHRRYFSEVFKKQTGMTPSEFKESFLGKAGR
ncbi:response regulator [Paenibacillus sp.]|uniref:response regulator n=1 Tax=Paenibacillus sp. TaxID=58172 RepID=UPI002D4157A9|nr:response regulator [Paenibacillus sp.]HZG56231.1 response regulator [Paenibacillus sp.]